MDGFVAEAEAGAKGCGLNQVDNPNCSQSATPDVMGYHDAREIPNYWQYVQNFVLDDHMFEPNRSCFGVSWGYYIEQGVQADCPNDQMTCAPQPQRVGKGLATVVPDIWNPLPEFDTVNQDGQTGNIQATIALTPHHSGKVQATATRSGLGAVFAVRVR